MCMRIIVKIMLLLAMLMAHFMSIHADEVSFTSSDLPIVIIQTQKAINADSKVLGTMKIVNNGVGQLNHLTDTPNDYDGYVGVKWRGESSLSFNQKKYTIETWTKEGNDTAVSLLGMPAEEDWVLLAPYNDVSMVRDVFAYYMWNQMGHWGPRTQMCEVVVNGEYMGVYALCESIKRDKNRVDVNKLKPEDVAGRDVTGGYILRIDAVDPGDVTFQSKVKGIQVQQSWWGGSQTIEAPVTWTVFYPSKEDIQPEQKAYIQQYVDSAELAIQAPHFDDPVEGYAGLIDVASFVDYFIHTEVSLNADGFKRSAYYYKDKDKKDGTRGKLFAGPVWDFNLAYGNCNFCNANNVKAWVYQGCETNPTPTMWRRLLQDTAFANAVKCRYLQLRETILSEEAIDLFLDNYAQLLDQAKDRQLKKYKEILKTNNPWDWGPTSFFAAYRVSSYQEEIDYVKSWFRQRLDFLDQHLPGQCAGVDGIQPLSFYQVGLKHDGQQAFISSPKPLKRVDVVNAVGACLQSHPADGSQQVALPLDRLPHGLIVFVCYAADGSMVSRTMIR